MENALVELLPGIVDAYGAAYAEVAAQWFEQLVGSSPMVGSPDRREAVTRSVRYALRPYREGAALSVVQSRVASVVLRHARQAGRDVIDGSVRATPGVRYARRLTGAHSCDFCVILASRGPVYGTELDAGGWGNRYHDDCDCEPVPVRGTWRPDSGSPSGVAWDGESPGYDFDKLYLDEYRPFWRPGDKITDVTRRRREARAKAKPAGRPGRPKGSKNKKPKVATGAGSGGKKPPTVKPVSGSEFDRERNLLPEVKASKRGTIVVEPGSDAGDSELRIGRILSRRGMNVVHLGIVNEKNRTNPDIALDGASWEIKSPKGSSERTIENQFKRAKKQSGRFILDLSRCGIPDEQAIRQAERRFFGTPGFSKMIVVDKKENVYFYQH